MATDSSKGLKPFRIDMTKGRPSRWKEFMMPCLDGVDINEHFEKVQNMEIRDDDIMLLSFPKCGTHWLWRILDLLVNQTTDYGDRCVDYGFIDLQPPERVANLESPRILATHLPLQHLPKQVAEKRIKMVHVYRNPKAVAVSLYHMLKNAGMMPDVSLEKIESQYFASKGPGTNFAYYMDQVAEFQKNNPDVPVFHISYEELKLNTVESITKIAEYLRVSASPEFIQKVADAVSFKKQKEEENKSAHESVVKTQFYRKGEIDDWKNYLTVAQSERMDAFIKERAPTCQFTAKYATSG